MEQVLSYIVWLVGLGVLSVLFYCSCLLPGFKRLKFYARYDSSGPGGRYVFSIASTAIVMSLFGAITLGIDGYWKGQVQKDEDPMRLAVEVGWLGLLGGLFFGTAVALAFAPAKFLNGPAAKKWRKLIGTENVTTGRAVCGALAVLIGILYAWFLWL